MLTASIEDSYNAKSEESDQDKLVDTDDHIRIKEELNREFEEEKERQRLFNHPGITHANKNIPDSSDDEEESGYRYTYPYPIEDHFKTEPEYYGEPPCTHCKVQFDHKNEC